jgi:hypothetical protein
MRPLDRWNKGRMVMMFFVLCVNINLATNCSFFNVRAAQTEKDKSLMHAVSCLILSEILKIMFTVLTLHWFLLSSLSVGLSLRKSGKAGNRLRNLPSPSVAPHLSQLSDRFPIQPQPLKQPRRVAVELAMPRAQVYRLRLHASHAGQESSGEAIKLRLLAIVVVTDAG